MPDKISILSHSRNYLAKTWRADGSITPYDRPKYFNLFESKIANIHELSDLMTGLEGANKSCVIRGRYVGDARAHELDPASRGGKVLRRLDIFEDQPLHAVLIEVDRYRPLAAHPFMEPLAAAQEYIQDILPPEFHEISFHWQLSNSAGKDPDLLKIHLWFWLAHAATSEQLRSWAQEIDLGCDHTVFNPVQVHYTSAPVFEQGVADPVPVRSGFYEGLLGGEVLLNLSSILTSDRKIKKREMTTVAAARDPTARFLHDHGLALGTGKEGQIHIDCPFAAGHGSPRKSLDETSYFLQGTGGYETGRFVCFHDTCKRNHPHTDFMNALGVYADDFDVAEAEAQVVPLPRMARDKQGRLLATLPNLGVVFDRPDHFGQEVRFDTFLNNTMIAPFGTEQWRALEDVDIVNLRLMLEKRFGFAPIGRELMRDALLLGAWHRKFDSAQHWLETLPPWDGRARVEGFLVRYLGAEAGEYSDAVSRYLWTALAGRVMVPGIKADMVPIFVGKQGIRKSSAARAIAPSPDFFTEINLNERDADQSRIMRGKLVGEIGELRGLHTRDLESIKSFIARTHEEWIPKYLERATVFPRRLVFIGTTNSTDFLADASGERRWLPVPVENIDISAIEKDRNQLWAEAKLMFEMVGVDWAAEGLAGEQHSLHRRVEPWEDAIEKWLDSPDDMTGETPRTGNKLQIAEIAREACGVETRNYTPSVGHRIGKILQVWGYKLSKPRGEGGKSLRVWSL